MLLTSRTQKFSGSCLKMKNNTFQEKNQEKKSINVCQVSERKTLRFESHVSFELCPVEKQIPIQTNYEADKDLWMTI